MSIQNPPSTDPNVLADAEAVLQALGTGKSVDPVVARRIQERSAKTRERILRDYGPQDIAVPAIRELRNG